MADTLQTVHWSLGTDGRNSGELWLPEGLESHEKALWESIRRLGLEQRLRSAFQVTRPLWYGLWIDSPLTATQCSLLRDVFRETARLVPRYRRHIEDFARALADSTGTGEPLHVELTPPGHVDFGWVTTFVHCPRCKAEGPVKRWLDTYPEEPLDCPVCGSSYTPAAMYSSKEAIFAETVCCRSCGAVHRVRDFPDDEIQVLEYHHAFEAFNEEMGWLRRVQEFYERHQNLEGEVKPHFLMVLESYDPEVRETLFASTPFSDVELPSGRAAPLGCSHGWSREDQDVMDYLRHHHFSLLELMERMHVIEQSIERLGYQLFQSSPVRCTECAGQLA
jgi:hypothetical protein